MDSVVSDIFGKSATSVIDYLLEQSDNSINHEEISSRLLRSLKRKSESVIESIEGYQMTDSQKYRMRLIHAHMDYIIALRAMISCTALFERLNASRYYITSTISDLEKIPDVLTDSG